MGNFYSQMGMETRDPFLLQSVSHEIFDTILVQSETSKAMSRPSAPLGKQLHRDEENALHYACGYVPFKLVRKYQEQSNEKAEKFATCLTNMAVDQEFPVEDYTTEWLQKVDRGGLFCVSPHCCEFFRAIEHQVRARLPQLLVSQIETKDEWIHAVVVDQDVQFFSTILSTNIDDEANVCQLLQEIVDLWVTIRGFSTTSSWMEQYKRTEQKTTRRVKGLRKSLK